MIEINLLPEELKPKQEEFSVLQLRKVIIVILPAALSLLIIIHLCLGCLLLIKTMQYKSMNKKWIKLSSQRRKVDTWKREHSITSRQSEQMTDLLGQRITVSDKMQILVQALPNGIWFNYLSLEQKKFNLKGSVVSLKQNQMSLLNSFLSRLKKDRLFFKDFASLQLGRMDMRSLGGFSIMDFVLEGDLK